jgi:ketosteroid isomerase-like protein
MPTDTEIVERVLGLMADLDVEAVLGYVADDLVLELPFRADGGPRRMEGDAAKRFIRAMPKLLDSMPFPEVVVHGPVPSGQIVAEYRSEGVTHAGRPYHNAYVGFFTLHDGRITSWREYFDPNVVAAAFPGT